MIAVVWMLFDMKNIDRTTIYTYLKETKSNFGILDEGF